VEERGGREGQVRGRLGAEHEAHARDSRGERSLVLSLFFWPRM
jgi:hypothetical protein